MTAPGPRPAEATRVLVLAADPSSAITEIRLTTPLAPLVASGRIQLRVLPWHEGQPTDLDDCDTVIGQRPLTARHLKLLQAAHARGAAVVVEIDDLLTQPAPHLQQHATLLRQAPWVERALDEADGISVSTPRLGQALARPGRRIHLVPNHAAPQVRRPAPAPTVPGTPGCVLLAASDAVAAGPAFEALRRLQAARGPQLRIVAVGPVASSAAAAGLQVEAHPVLPRERFLSLAAALPRAVAVIPLDDSAFSACKSAVKWFDFAAVGLATLMADRPPYSDVVVHGQTGWLLPDDATAWADALALALDDEAARVRVANAAEQLVRERHALTGSTAAWQALLDEIDTAHAERPLPRRAPAWHQRLLAPWHALAVALRRANRARLARRQRPR